MNEETLLAIQARLAALAKFTSNVSADIARELETLKQPKATMTRAQAIEEAATELDKLHASSYRIIANDGAVWKRNSFAKALILPPLCAIRSTVSSSELAAHGVQETTYTIRTSANSLPSTAPLVARCRAGCCMCRKSEV